MLIFLKRNLVFFAVPKTGTSALEEALRPLASIDLRNPPDLRHITAGQFDRVWAPFLAREYGFTSPTSVAVVRDPLERLASWHRYRSRPELDGKPASTRNVTFAEFVAETLTPEPRPFARIYSQDRILLDGTGRARVSHIFAYPDFDQAVAFLSERLGRTLSVPKRNVSPNRIQELPPALEAKLREVRAREFSFFEQVAAAGCLETPQAA